MKYFIAVTDNQWFHYLSTLQPDELNFWQPGGRGAFSAIPENAPFLFKLHSPHNFIVGGGFFLRHSFLPVSVAWETFKEKNGMPDFESFHQRIRHYRERMGRRELDPVIGCIVLAMPFFFKESVWIPVPKDWSANIVQGKTYDTQDQTGRILWEQVSERLQGQEILPVTGQMHLENNELARERYGSEYLTRPRLGQGSFRLLVTEAYGRRCAMTGERTLPVLNASHIKPYAKQGPHEVSNGLLLREDLHTLFDRGYLTITRDLRIEVSQRIKQDYGNGKEYYAMHGKELLVIPGRVEERPSMEFIEWHNEHVYVS